MFDFNQFIEFLTTTPSFILTFYCVTTWIFVFTIYNILTMNRNVKDQSENFQQHKQTKVVKYTEIVKDSEQTTIEKALELVGKLNESDLQDLLEECASRVLIPNWYTKTDLEKLANTVISDNQWNKILISNQLIDETNAMCLQWFDSNCDSDYVDKYDSDYVDEYDSDDTSEEEIMTNSIKTKIQTRKTVNKLDKMNYIQLKKLAKVKNNKMTKKQLITKILSKSS